jgi:hypothetical protein
VVATRLRLASDDNGPMPTATDRRHVQQRGGQ